jgi:hypothetical protein
MTIDEKTTDNKVQIRNIFVPIDCSECSLDAAKYATRWMEDRRSNRSTRHSNTRVF